MDRLAKLCFDALDQKTLTDYSSRLKEELREIEVQNETDYFLSLYDKKLKFSHNENNLLVAHLLDLVDNVDLTKEPASVMGEFPDIDTDFLPVVRDYLKDEWAPKTFGRDKVCSIGAYGTLKLKSVLLDMTRIHGGDRNEVIAITKTLPDKDDEGHNLTFEVAVEISPALKAFCEKNPEIAEASKKILTRRKTFSMHAAGIIISSVPLDDIIPIQIAKEGIPCSAWAEGQNTQDLSAVGLVKQDWLIVKSNEEILLACQNIKKKYGLKSICALEGQSDWSDTSYLNDPKAIEMANKGDLIGVFQFEKDGIQRVVRAGGVDSFDDLMAYNALYRPGTLSVSMHERFIERKRGREEYEMHPSLKPILEKTYGIMIYQESAILILNKVGNIPLRDCETIRKAISKKKVEKFIKYKEMFLENGKINLNCSQEEVEKIWETLEAFSLYAFNKAHSCAYTYLSSRLLYLKAHYPLEFFHAKLYYEEKEEDIQRYKKDAKRHGIEVLPLDINKSKQNFVIEGDFIRIGYRNLKGIGDAIVEDVINNQPYESFANFIHKFGTTVNVLKALVCLEAFPEEKDKIKLWNYVEYYKKYLTSKKNAEINHIKKMEKLNVQLQELGLNWDSDSKEKEFLDLKKKYIKYSVMQENKMKATPCMSLNDLEKEITIDEKIIELFSKTKEELEKQFYGFVWNCDLENCVNYQGNCNFTIAEESAVAPVEIVVNKIEQKISQKGTTYYLITGEDDTGTTGYIQVWTNDYTRWKTEMREGNMLRIRVKAPSGGFRRFTFESFPRFSNVPKDQDYRLVVLKLPVILDDDALIL